MPRQVLLDVRIVPEKLAKLRHEDRVCRIFGRRDADSAGGPFAKLAQRYKFRLDLLEARSDGPHEALARFCGRDAARGAGQKPNAEARFELADGLAKR